MPPGSTACQPTRSVWWLVTVLARAVDFTYSWSRLSVVFASYMIGFFLNRGGVSAVSDFIAFAMLEVVLSIGLFGPPTRGLQLEEISY